MISRAFNSELISVIRVHVDLRGHMFTTEAAQC